MHINMIWQVLLVVVVGLILRSYWISTKRMRSVRLVNPEQHPGKPLIMPYEDMLVSVFRFIKRILSGSTESDYEFSPKLITKWQNSIHSFQMAFFGIPMIATWDPQIIREVACNTQQFGKGSNLGLISDRIIGQGILLADGERWSKQRRVMNPSFKFARLKTIFPVFVHTTHLLINALKNEIREGRSKFNPFHLLSKMTMEAIGKAGFGFDFGNFDKEPSLELQSYQFILEKFADPKYFFGFVAKLPTKENKMLQESFKSFNKLITDLIAKKRAVPQQEGEKDLLQMLIAATDEGDKLTDEELIHNVNTLFIGGQETSSASLTCTLYLLAKNKEYQERVRSEAKEVLNGRDPEYADIAKYALISAVVKESLRIYPPLLGFSRMATEDCIVNGYHVPKGTMFSLLTIAVHKSPEYYEDPEAFKPERWLGSNENENKINKAWMPFGVGSRTCIGNHFTMLQMKCALSMLIQEFKLIETSELKFKPSIALKPVDAFTIGFEAL